MTECLALNKGDSAKTSMQNKYIFNKNICSLTNLYLSALQHPNAACKLSICGQQVTLQCIHTFSLLSYTPTKSQLCLFPKPVY